MRFVRAHAPALAVAGLIAGSALVRIWVNRGFQGPQILCDEYIYAGIARGFATTGHLGFGGGPSLGSALLYPALIAPAWFAHTMTTVFDLVKVVNALVISLTAIPVYLWTRRVVSPWWAVVAAVLVLLMTGLVLSGMLMSENAALPVFAFAVFAIALAVEEPTLWRQAVILVAVLAAYEVRTQALVLVAILPAAVLLDVVIAARAGVPRADALSRLRRFLPLAVSLVVGFFAYLAHSGFSLGHAVGAYHRVATTHYHPLNVRLWTARHAGEAVLVLAVAPFCALLVLLFIALSRGLENPIERAFVATASASVLFFLLQAGMYASAFNPGIHERYSMYAFPPLLIALVVWLGRGLPRPASATLAAALSSLALAGFIIFGGFLHAETPSPVFARLSLYFFTRIPVHMPGGLVVTQVALVALSVGAAVVFAKAHATPARLLLPSATALLLLLASHSAYGALSTNSRGWANSTGPVRSWIDKRIGSSSATASYLYVPNPSSFTSSTVLANTQFWNRSIGTVYTIGSPELCPIPTKALRLDDRTGILADTRSDDPRQERYVVTDRGLPIAGKLLASGGSTAQPLSIYRPARPLRLASQLTGVYSDGWTGEDASYRRYWEARPRKGRIEITLSRAVWTGPDIPGRVTVTVSALGGSRNSRLALRRWTAHRGASTVLRLRTPTPPFEVRVHVAPTFSPAQFGLADPRQLGVQLTLADVPAG